jgi:hypothetical protein
MTQRIVGSRDARAVLAGMIIIAALLAVSRILPHVMEWRTSTEARLLAQTNLLDRATREAAELPALRDLLKVREHRVLALGPLLLTGASGSVAAGMLAGTISGAAAQANVKLGTVQTYVDSAHGRVFTRVGVRADATGDVRGLVDMLRRLEQGPTLVSIREFTVAQPEAAAPDSRAETLRVGLLVQALAIIRPDTVRK